MKKYAYCFGCDEKFGASDGIASATRSSYFDLRNFLLLNTSILGIVNLWLLHFVGTALFFEYWDTVWNTTIRETINVGSSDCDYLWIHCIHTSSDPRLWTSRRVPSPYAHCKNWLLDIRVSQPLETDLGLSLCVNPRIQTSPGTPSKIDAIVRYILLDSYFDEINHHIKILGIYLRLYSYDWE